MLSIEQLTEEKNHCFRFRAVVPTENVWVV